MHKDSLEHLRLDPDLVYPLLADEDEDDQWPSVEGFGDFGRLRSLDTTFSNLFGRPGGGSLMMAFLGFRMARVGGQMLLKTNICLNMSKCYKVSSLYEDVALCHILQ